MNKFFNKTLLIFDLDGTLIDSVPDLANSVNFSLKNNGLKTHSIDTIRTFVGNGSHQLCQRAVGSDNKALIDKVHDDFLKHYAAHTCIDTTPYAGVCDHLPQLANHFTLAIATNKPEQFLPIILAKFGWTHLFKLVIGGDTLPTKKPDPAPLLYLCEQFNINKNQAIMIGDSKNDIQAGKNAGMATIGLSYGYNYNEPIECSAPDGVFADFSDMANMLLSTILPH